MSYGEGQSKIIQCPVLINILPQTHSHTHSHRSAFTFIETVDAGITLSVMEDVIFLHNLYSFLPQKFHFLSSYPKYNISLLRISIIKN